jgi:hypothetical protein
MSTAVSSNIELLRTLDRGVATLTLNRPQQHNALSSLMDALQHALDPIAHDRRGSRGCHCRRGQGILRGARSQGNDGAAIRSKALKSRVQR